MELQNKNNNACTAADSYKSSSDSTEKPEKQRKSLKTKADKKEQNIPETKVEEPKKDKERAASKSKRESESPEIKPAPLKSDARSVQEKKPADRDEETSTVYQTSKITHNVTSRFGMKTFTVVPPKPSVPATAVPSTTLTLGAIKIDDQGNMVKAGIYRNTASTPGVNNCDGSPLLGKAKAFWSSSEKQEGWVPLNKGLIDKATESTDGPRSPPAVNSETTMKTGIAAASFDKTAERVQPNGTTKGDDKIQTKVVREERVEVESTISVSKPVQQPTYKPNLPPSVVPDLRKDLSFLKPSRRTSSQYVASAITRYAPKSSAKPGSIPSLPESSAPLKSQTTAFQRSGRSIQVNPHQSSQSSLSDNKENESAFKSNPPGPKRSMSYPEYVSDSRRDFGEVRPDWGGSGSYVESIKGNFNSLERETTKNNHGQPSGPTQINMTANHDRDNIKHIRPRSPSPAQCPLRPSAKPPTAIKTVSQGQTTVSKACSVK